MSEPPCTTDRLSGFDSKFFWVTGSLLLVIIAALSVLWLRERGHRIRSQAVAAQLRGDNDRLQTVMGNILMARPAQSVSPVRREDLPAETGQVNGESRRILHISAAAAKRFGFAPGDLVAVDAERAASQPQTAPTPGPAGGAD